MSEAKYTPPPIKSDTGASSIGGFNQTHMNEYIKHVAEKEGRHKERRKIAHESKTLELWYKKAIATLWKRGCYTMIGSLEREITPDDICGTLKIIYKAMDGRLLGYEEARLFNKNLRHIYHAGKKRKNKIFIGWGYIKELNAIKRRLRKTEGEENDNR